MNRDLYVGKRIRTRDHHILIVESVETDEDGKAIRVSCSVEGYIPIPCDTPCL